MIRGHMSSALLSLCHSQALRDRSLSNGNHLESGGVLMPGFSPVQTLASSHLSIPASLCWAVRACPPPWETEASGHFQRETSQVTDGCRGCGVLQVPHAGLGLITPQAGCRLCRVCSPLGPPNLGGRWATWRLQRVTTEREVL